MPRLPKLRPDRCGSRRRYKGAWAAIVLTLGMSLGVSPAQELPPASSMPAGGPVAPRPAAGGGDAAVVSLVEEGLLDAAFGSVFGDAYAPGRWRPLPLRTFFTEGWGEAWACGPEGRDGTTPRHGWLGAFGGVFYRLWFTSLTYRHDLAATPGGDAYAGDYVLFLPLSRRLEVAFDVPFATGNGTSSPRSGYARNVGDFTVTPRVLMSESRAATQVLTLIVRTPTGSTLEGNRVTSLTPRYEFWTNPVGSWVFRGGLGPPIPLNQGRGSSGPGTSIAGDIALGRYVRPHDVPVGDLVFYVACNFDVPLRGTPEAAHVGLGPGTRFHITNNYFFTQFWEFPVARSHAQDYILESAIVKVF
ncbi:hypothetical protein [Aquisphaera giovannonii]|uniref:hypothetical protein n=1 Tax=Aquisphaera giovannonii TaxID=406548 RepID=UPI0011DF7C0F|nr:hypothetical protein [Aquisphaera giovannonii]